MTLEQYKEKLQRRISELQPYSEKQPLDLEHAFKKRPISFRKALDIARQKNPRFLIWNCCEFKHGYVFLIGSKPDFDSPLRDVTPGIYRFYFHVNYYTGFTCSFSYAELEMNLLFHRSREKKTVWIDITKEETLPVSLELHRLQNLLLSVTLIEKEYNTGKQEEKMTRNEMPS